MQGPLDPFWSRLFAGVRFIKHFEAIVGFDAVCFRHAVFAPPGNHSPIDVAYGARMQRGRPWEEQEQWDDLSTERAWGEMNPRWYEMALWRWSWFLGSVLHSYWKCEVIFRVSVSGRWLTRRKSMTVVCCLLDVGSAFAVVK